MENKLTKEQQLEQTKQIYEVLCRLQAELPGKHYEVFQSVKAALAQVNNSIGEELKEAAPPLTQVLNGAEEVHVSN